MMQRRLWLAYDDEISATCGGRDHYRLTLSARHYLGFDLARVQRVERNKRFELHSQAVNMRSVLRSQSHRHRF